MYLLLLAITIGCACSARILEEADPQFPVPVNQPVASDPPEIDDPEEAPMVGPSTTLPSGQIPATNAISPVANVAPIAGPAVPLPSVPGAVVPPISTAAPVTNVAPVATPTTTLPSGPAATAATGTNTAGHPEATLAFFMHDVLGGTHPSGRVVTGIIANSDDNGLPFSKANSQVFPINGGVPLNNINNLVNNNNVPFLAGLNGSPSSTNLHNTGNNNVVSGGNQLPFVSAGQLPAGITLQQLMFGTITVVDNELTEGHELGSSVLGKGQGFYLSSSLDGTSHTLALTTLFHSGDHDHEHVDDSISFFGIHRTGSPISEIAVIGGTGKYQHAKGYATIESLHQVDQHTTDGVETVTHFTVYLTYEV
ncbi:Dirigent protein [Heracleum sosnowskyi]|uniref:Dirigent protein n=1 Tax=Heracleum sosnowskyi TaxID=360622 RepID=A0AAD8I2U7_9APIA|nr:Dirigent protein [Heracleum sosnowskyi]